MTNIWKVIDVTIDSLWAILIGENHCFVSLTRNGNKEITLVWQATHRNFLFFALVCLGAAAAGTGLAWTSPVLDQLKTPDSEIPITKDEGTWIASMLAIGAIIGAVPSGILADQLGRKKAAIIIAVPYIISYLLIVFAQNVWWLYAARLLIGTFTLLFCYKWL